MNLGSWRLGAPVTFVCNTHSPTTFAATDADSAPTYRVYEDVTAGPLLTGTMSLLDGSNTNGFYAAQITVSTGNGFEQGKSYTVYIEATVGGITATTSRYFQIGAEVSLTWMLGTLLTETVTGYLAAAFKKLFDVTTPVLTAQSVNQTGDGYARLGAPAGASVSADVAAVGTAVAAVPTATQNADALLKRDMSAVSGEASRSPLNALRFLRNLWTIGGGTLHVKKEDDATDAWTGVVTTTAGDPVSQIDPS